MTEIKVEMKSWRAENEREQQEKGKQEITHSAYLKVKEGYSDERTEGRREGERFSVLDWLVNTREMMTAAPYKTWTSAGV